MCLLGMTIKWLYRICEAVANRMFDYYYYYHYNRLRHRIRKIHFWINIKILKSNYGFSCFQASNDWKCPTTRKWKQTKQKTKKKNDWEKKLKYTGPETLDTAKYSKQPLLIISSVNVRKIYSFTLFFFSRFTFASLGRLPIADYRLPMCYTVTIWILTDSKRLVSWLVLDSRLWLEEKLFLLFKKKRKKEKGATSA